MNWGFSHRVSVVRHLINNGFLSHQSQKILKETDIVNRRGFMTNGAARMVQPSPCSPVQALCSLHSAIAQYKSNIMDRIFEGSLVQQQLKLLCHQAMTGEAIVNGPNYRSSLSFPIRFLKRSMFSHNYFSLLMRRGVKT